VNLTSFVRDPFAENAHFDWDEYRRVVKVFTRMARQRGRGERPAAGAAAQ